MSLRILLADDHLLVRQSLRAVLEREGFQVIGEASDGQEAAQIARTARPDVAVLDIAMPVLNGIDAAREVSKDSTRTKTILLTMYSDDQYVLESLRAGVSGYVLKNRAVEELVQAIRNVARGEFYLSSGISRTVVQAFLNKVELEEDPLSVRERQVLQLVAEGNTTKEVSSLLGISAKTVESHRNHIMEKLNVHDIAGLVRYAVRRGIVRC